MGIMFEPRSVAAAPSVATSRPRADRRFWTACLVGVTATVLGCGSSSPATDAPPAPADAVELPAKFTRAISYDGFDLDVVIDQPANPDVDVVVVFHGTVLDDADILTAADMVLENLKAVVDRDDMMFVSVAYPSENMLLGDSTAHAEAALLWVKNAASQELGVTVKKVFLVGHSQGGYLVTRLNSMQPTDGVIANAPGPLNLVYRCELEESGQVQPGAVCAALRAAYGTTAANPDAYLQRSLLSFTTGFKADALFVQGLADSAIQLYSWPGFKQAVMDCTTCQDRQFLDLPGLGHGSMFMSPEAKVEVNGFIATH